MTFSVLLLLAGLLRHAEAAPVVDDCTAGQAPAPYWARNCSSICTEVHTGSGLYRIECDLSVGSDGEAYAVYDYPADGYPNFSVWGAVSGVGEYCCFIDDPGNAVDHFLLQGGGSDEILSYEGDGMSMANPGPGHRFLAEVRAAGGNDWIYGSSETDVWFVDLLYGEGGDDNVFGWSGGDRLDGGLGEDDLLGEGGDDYIRGGAGKDYLHGNAGDNVLCGGGSIGAYGDSFQALVGTNTFYAHYSFGAPAPSGYLTGGSSACGHTSWGSSWVSGGGSCSYTLTTTPSECASSSW